MICATRTHAPSPPARALKLRPLIDPLGSQSQYQTILDGRRAEVALRAWLDKNESRILRALLELWDSQQATIRLNTVRDAILSGQIPRQWLTEFERDYSRFVNAVMAPQWAGALTSASLIEAGIPGWTWQGGTQWLARYVESRGGSLITQLVNEQFQAIRATLYHYTVEDPISATRLTQILRPMVGVTERSALAAIRLREQLTAAGLKPTVIDKRIFNYLRRANARRAETIARTELATAWHDAQYTSIQAASRSGDVLGTITAKWKAAPDELVCPICGSLNDQVVGLGEQFTATISRGSGDDKHDVNIPIDRKPPAHVNCRCCLSYHSDLGV